MISYKGFCVGGPKDGQFMESYVKIDWFFRVSILGKTEPKILGSYRFNEKEEQTLMNFFIWKDAFDPLRKS